MLILQREILGLEHFLEHSCIRWLEVLVSHPLLWALPFGFDTSVLMEALCLWRVPSKVLWNGLLTLQFPHLGLFCLQSWESSKFWPVWELRQNISHELGAGRWHRKWPQSAGAWISSGQWVGEEGRGWPETTFQASVIIVEIRDWRSGEIWWGVLFVHSNGL